MSCSFTVEVGAYLLGAIAPAERTVVEEHLSNCSDCRQELVHLAPLPGLMLRVSAEEVAGVASTSVDRSSLESLERRINRRRSVRRRLAAAAVAAVLGGGGVWFGASHGAQSPAELRGSDARTGVRLTASMHPEDWGTGIRLSISGVPTGVRCWLVVHGRDGATESGGSWRATRYPTSQLPASTSIPLSKITAMDVVTSSGDRLIDVHRA